MSTTAVQIYHNVYNKYKENAFKERFEIKPYINNRLELLLRKEEFIKRLLPDLSVDSYVDNTIIIKDLKERRLIDVVLNGMNLTCDFCKSNDCCHTKFVWSSLEIGMLGDSRRES